MAQVRRVDERRNQPRRHGRTGDLHDRIGTRCGPRAAYAFALLLDSFAARRISSISVLRRRPTAAAAATPAAFTARPARLPVVPPPPPRVLKPCSASAASAAVAATATSSATSGLWSSLIKASPAVSDVRLPPSPLRRSLGAFFETPLDLVVVLFAIVSSPVGFRCSTHRRVPVSTSTDLLC